MAEAGKNGRPDECSAASDRPIELTAQYIATLVHELRNPLAPIRNATQLLRSLCSDPHQIQAIEMISRQVVSLTHMLDDLTDATSSQRSLLSLTRQRVDVAEIVEPALRTIRPAVDTRRQSLFVSLPNEPVRMYCDPVRLAQVLQTLLDNATRHTPAGGAIALKVQANDDHLLIEVSDNGAGISTERLPAIFNVFAHSGQPQGPTAERSGFNLAISRNIVEMHGGTISAQSAGIGRGSRFAIRLPLDQTEDAANSAATSQAASGRRILVIDDQEDSAKSLADVLARAGHSVLVAHSGELGIALAEQFQPEAVIIDIGLPGMDGFEVGRQLRQNRATAEALLIAVSGLSLKQFRDLEAYSVFRHYLLKPTNPHTLLNIIERTLDDEDRV